VYVLSYFFAIVWALKFFSICFLLFLESFVLSVLDVMSFLMACASCVSEFAGTRRPVLLFSTISGMPPTRVATIGRLEIIASRLTRPNPSRSEGRMNRSELFINCGIFLRRPSRMTWFVRPRLVMSLSRAWCWGPAPAIAKRRDSLRFGGSWVRSFWIARSRMWRPLRGWSSATVSAVMVW